MAGNWGPWLPWSPCSETCGKGMQSRIRLCNNPPPAFDGPQCEGSDTQTQVCKERPCPGEKAKIILPQWIQEPLLKTLMQMLKSKCSCRCCFFCSGWEVVVVGDLGSLQCFMWWWDQTEDTPLCQPFPTTRWQAV